MILAQVALALLFMADMSWAYDPSANMSAPSDQKPHEIEGVGVTEKLGAKLDLNLEFVNENNESVKLGQYFNGHKPVMLAIVYYSCPNLCNFQLNGVIDAVKNMRGSAGQDYDLVAVSMDHNETANVAAAKKENYMTALGQVGAEKGWHFLVGKQENVQKLADQVGFTFKWNENLKQYAHAAATIIITPEGVVSRYLHGITYDANTMRLSLVEASNGKIGSFIEQFTMFCFQFDPAKNKYTLYAYNVMRLGAAFTVIVMLIFLVPVWMRERQRKVNLA